MRGSLLFIDEASQCNTRLLIESWQAGGKPAFAEIIASFNFPRIFFRENAIFSCVTDE